MVRSTLVFETRFNGARRTSRSSTIRSASDEVYEGYPKPLWRQEGLSLRASLAMHTRNSAFQLHQEKLRVRFAQASPPT